MARRGISEQRREAAALQGGRRAVARGERPLYRLTMAQDGKWSLMGCPWLPLDAQDRRGALTAASSAIAEWLAVPSDAFDLEA